MKVRVHIERLVLDEAAVGAVDPAQLRDALVEALGRRIAQDGIGARLPAGGALDRVDAGPVELAPGADPGRAGGTIAEALHRGLVR